MDGAGDHFSGCRISNGWIDNHLAGRGRTGCFSISSSRCRFLVPADRFFCSVFCVDLFHETFCSKISESAKNTYKQRGIDRRDRESDEPY